MDIRQFRYLCALAEHRHFARAAEACAVTQSTLSQRLRQLETELDVTIVRRGHRFEGFTPDGERVLHWARRILHDCTALEQDLQTGRSEVSGEIVLGVIPSALPATAQLTTPLRRRHPGLHVRLQSLSSQRILQGLEDFSLDAGLSYLETETAGMRTLRQKRLYGETYSLIMPVDHPLAVKATVSWAEAAQWPLCLLTRDMKNRRIIDSVFDSIDCSVTPAIETGSITALFSHARMGDCLSIVPGDHSHVFGLWESIAFRPLTDPAPSYDVGLLAREESPVSPMIEALWTAAEWMIDSVNDIMDSNHLKKAPSPAHKS